MDTQSIPLDVPERKSSNMAIVDVEIPTGYVYTGYRFLDEFGTNAVPERVDERGSNIIFYFNDVRSIATTFVVEFLERFTVENPQQLPVTIYDYYDPGQTLTKYFLPSTSAALSTITTTRPPTRPPTRLPNSPPTRLPNSPPTRPPNSPPTRLPVPPSLPERA